MTSSSACALSVDQLSLQYDGVTVLDSIALNIPEGAVVGLIGRNGAGKSSLIRCMLGLSVPQSGSASILGDPSLALSDAVRARIGYVPQQSTLIESMRVWQHIEYIGGFYPRWTAQRARDLCIKIGLPEDLKVKNLSVGDKQKLSIVLALAHDPELVLMDEPVASLDPMMRRDFMRILFDTDRPRTILLSSHLLSDLERVVSHVALVRDGKLQLFDAWDGLAENVRVINMPTHTPEQAGILRQTPTGKDWRLVVDMRQLEASRLCEAAKQSPALGLEDLFEELNA